FLWLKRLGDIVIRTRLQPEDNVNGVSLSGEHDDRHIGVTADGATNIHAVHSRQHQIQQNKIRVMLLKGWYSIISISNGDWLQPLRFEDNSQHFRNGRIIIYHQDFWRHFYSPTRSRTLSMILP